MTPTYRRTWRWLAGTYSNLGFPVEFLEFPDETVVIAIGDIDAFEYAQAGYLLARGEQVEDFQTQVPAEVIVVLLLFYIVVEFLRQRIQRLVIRADVLSSNI